MYILSHREKNAAHIKPGTIFYGSTYYVARTLLIQEQGARKAKVRDS